MNNNKLGKPIKYDFNYIPVISQNIKREELTLLNNQFYNYNNNVNNNNKPVTLVSSNFSSKLSKDHKKIKSKLTMNISNSLEPIKLLRIFKLLKSFKSFRSFKSLLSAKSLNSFFYFIINFIN